MRKQKWFLVFLASLFIFSCANPLKSPLVPEGETNGLAYSPKTQTGKTYQGMLHQTESSVQKLFDTLALYDEDGSVSAQFSSIGENDVLDPENVGALLDASVFQKTRIRSGTAITLEEELYEIVAEYQTAMERMAPDISLLAMQSNVQIVDGMVVVDVDEALNPKTLTGALSIELLNAELRGESVDRIFEDAETIATHFENKMSAKGLYKRSTKPWKKAEVFYSFDKNIDIATKNALINAMNDWKTQVPGLKFTDKTGDTWHAIISLIPLTSLVNMKSEDLSEEKLWGYANVGAISWGQQTLCIHTYLHDYVRGGTTRHELGHVLGLNHEHQRWDRDAYIDIYSIPEACTNVVDYGMITKGTYWTKSYDAIEIRYYKLKILWWTIRIPYPVLVRKTESGTIPESYYTTYFDFKSVMLYNGIPIHSSKQYLNDGRKVTDL